MWMLLRALPISSTAASKTSPLSTTSIRFPGLSVTPTAWKSALPKSAFSTAGLSRRNSFSGLRPTQASRAAHESAVSVRDMENRCARVRPSASFQVVRVIFILILIAACAGPRREPAVRGLPRDDPSATLSVVWVGHATVLIRLGHRFVLTDPNLGGALFVVPRITPASLTPEEVPPLQMVLISHLHVDHFDTGT